MRVFLMPDEGLILGRFTEDEPLEGCYLMDFDNERYYYLKNKPTEKEKNLYEITLSGRYSKKSIKSFIRRDSVKIIPLYSILLISDKLPKELKGRAGLNIYLKEK